MTFGGNNNYDALLSGLSEGGYSSKPKVTATGGLSTTTGSPNVSMDLWDYSSPVVTPAASTATSQNDADSTLKEVSKTLTNLSGGGNEPRTYTNVSQMESYLVDAMKNIGFDQYFGASGEIPDWLTKDLSISDRSPFV